VGELGGVHCRDEHHLDHDVDDRADDHRRDDGGGQCLLRVLDLGRELVSLLEPEVREDDAGSDDGLEHTLRTEWREAARPVGWGGGDVGWSGEARREVPRVPLEQQDNDGEDRDGDLPPHDRAVYPGEPADAEEVYEREEGHQYD
jgi:hypothetical protein